MLDGGDDEVGWLVCMVAYL